MMNWKALVSQAWNMPSRLGEKIGWNFLIYNPGVFLEFALVAKRNAPLFARSVTEVFPDVRLLCDVGAGTGQFVKAFNDLGVQAEGFEYALTGRLFSRLIGVRLMRFDLVDSSTFPSCHKQFDLAYSLEVAEHIPEELSGKIVEALVDAAPIVVFTAAHPGQSGHGHINCQEKTYWAQLFRTHGYVEQQELTNLLKDNLIKRGRVSSFLIENVMVFLSHGD